MSQTSKRIFGQHCRYGCCGPNVKDHAVKRARRRVARRQLKKEIQDDA